MTLSMERCLNANLTSAPLVSTSALLRVIFSDFDICTALCSCSERSYWTRKHVHVCERQHERTRAHTHKDNETDYVDVFPLS